MGRFEEALGCWDQVIQLAPGASAPVEQKAYCKRAANLADQGVGWDVNEWSKAGIQFLDGNDWALSELAFSRALLQSPRNVRAICGKGIANFKWASVLRAEGNSGSVLRFEIAAGALREALETLLETQD